MLHLLEYMQHILHMQLRFPWWHHNHRILLVVDMLLGLEWHHTPVVRQQVVVDMLHID